MPVLGGGAEFWDGGEARISGPCVLMHPPNASHADHIGEGGLETVSIQFDPKWLSAWGFGFRLDRSRRWMGGKVSVDARHLVRTWMLPHAPDAHLAHATANFLGRALATQATEPPPWLDQVRTALDNPVRPTTVRLAAQLDLHPAWLVRAYRAAVGEGIQETLRRKRVERAIPLLRQSELPLAEIAAAAGFSDQSHMSRDFRTLTGRTPLQVRTERPLLEPQRSVG
jgi:AraC-like DNA-binding protein